MRTIFVYGTLLRGLERASALDSSKFLGPALIKARLFDLGSYPGIAEGNDDVIGEVYEVDEEVLGTLDAIEGYNEESPESSLYIRRPVTARKLSDGAEIDAETYFYTRSSGQIIKNIEYRAYRLEKENKGKQWVIAYGSNISTERINKRFANSGAPLAEVHMKGVLPEFQLVFNKDASSDSSVYANIRYLSDYAGCPAVAWELNAQQVAIIDGCEGVPTHYVKAGIPFRSDSGEEILATCYIAHPDRVVGGGEPRKNYVQLVSDGYEEMGFKVYAITHCSSLRPEHEDAYHPLLLSESKSHIPLSEAEMTDHLMDMYERYGTYAEVERQSGYPQSLIREYVRFARLPQELREAVRDTGLPRPLAIKIADAATTPAGYDLEKIKTLQAALPELDDDDRNKLLRRAKESPRVAVKDIVKKIGEPDPTHRITITLNGSDFKNVTDLAETRGESVQDFIINFLTDGLSREGY